MIFNFTLIPMKKPHKKQKKKILKRKKIEKFWTLLERWPLNPLLAYLLSACGSLDILSNKVLKKWMHD